MMCISKKLQMEDLVNLKQLELLKRPLCFANPDRGCWTFSSIQGILTDEDAPGRLP